MHDFDNYVFIKDCEKNGLLIDEHEVDVRDAKVVMRTYEYDGDAYVHVLVNGETLGFKEIVVGDHTK